MTDYRAIGTNLAARYAPAAALPTPSSANAIRSSTANLPNAISDLPCVLVVPDAGALEIPRNGTRPGSSDWLVRLYYDQVAGGSLERDAYALLGWLGVMLDVLLSDLDLAGVVIVARSMTWRVGIMEYAGVKYSGLEVRVHAVTSESWLPTA